MNRNPRRVTRALQFQLSDLLKAFSYVAQKKKNDPILIFSLFKQLIISAIKFINCTLGVWHRDPITSERVSWARGSNRSDRY